MFSPKIVGTHIITSTVSVVYSWVIAPVLDLVWWFVSYVRGTVINTPDNKNNDAIADIAISEEIRALQEQPLGNLTPEQSALLEKYNLTQQNAKVKKHITPITNSILTEINTIAGTSSEQEKLSKFLTLVAYMVERVNNTLLKSVQAHESLNAHDFTNTENSIIPELNAYLEIIQKLNIGDANIPIDTISSEVASTDAFKAINEKKQQSIKNIFTRIKSTYDPTLRITDMSGDVNPETDQNIPKLLSIAWSFVKYSDEQKYDDEYQGKCNRNCFAMNLYNNFYDGGGCIAGVVVRLVPFIGNLLKVHLTQVTKNKTSVGLFFHQVQQPDAENAQTSETSEQNTSNGSKITPPIAR